MKDLWLRRVSWEKKRTEGQGHKTEATDTDSCLNMGPLRKTEPWQGIQGIKMNCSLTVRNISRVADSPKQEVFHAASYFPRYLTPKEDGLGEIHSHLHPHNQPYTVSNLPYKLAAWTRGNLFLQQSHWKKLSEFYLTERAEAIQSYSNFVNNTFIHNNLLNDFL